MWCPRVFLTHLSGSSLSWTHQSSHSVFTKVPQISLLNTRPKSISNYLLSFPYRFILHATHGYIMRSGCLCISGFPHQSFRDTTTEPPQWLYRTNNTVSSRPSTMYTTWWPSHSAQQLSAIVKPHFLQEGSCASLSENMRPCLRCSFSNVAPEDLTHCIHCSDSHSKPNLFNVLSLQLNAPRSPKTASPSCITAAIATIVNKEFFLIYPVEGSGRGPKEMQEETKQRGKWSFYRDTLELNKPRSEDICWQEVYDITKYPPKVQSQTLGKLCTLDVIRYMRGGRKGQENNFSMEINPHMLSLLNLS